MGAIKNVKFLADWKPTHLIKNFGQLTALLCLGFRGHPYTRSYPAQESSVH